MDGIYLGMIARRGLLLPYMPGNRYLTTELDDGLNPITARNPL